MHAILLLTSLVLPAATPDTATLALLPPAAAEADAPIAYVIQDRAAALLSAARAGAPVHLKQVLSMAGRHGMTPASLSDPITARTAAERLGARLFTYGELKRTRGGMSLRVTAAEVGSARSQTVTEDLPKEAAAAVRAGSLVVARAVLALDHQQLPTPPPTAQPDTASDAAMARYAACYAIVIRQPISIEAPSVIGDAELSQAKAACNDAVQADPSFGAAWAALGLAHALALEDADAVSSLAHVKPEAGFIPLAWVTRFWLVTRFESNSAGERVLERALQQNPGFFLGRAYLAELYNAVGDQTKAAAEWRAYLARSPNNPYILTRMAYTLSRLGEQAEAVSISEQAVALDPASVELQLELASRCLDAGRIDQALATLEPLAARSDATADAILRLGYAFYLHGDLDKSQATLERSFRAARAPADWRTRARSKFDLALVAFKKGTKERARTLLLESVAQGLKPRPLNADEQALVALAKPEELVPPRKVTVREASPFVVESGVIAPDAARPAAPKGFEAVKDAP